MKMKIKRQSLKYLIISVVLFAELYFIFTFHGKSNTDIVLNTFKSYSLLIILSIYAFGRLYPAITKIRLRIYEALFCLGGVLCFLSLLDLSFMDRLILYSNPFFLY